MDSTLVEWILPDFTSTTWHDRTIGSMVMMSTLKACVSPEHVALPSHSPKFLRHRYFEYFVSIVCGIPTVTLEGEKADWEEIHRRLYRLYELGDEPSVWADMLRPILSRFVDAFDGNPDVQFWEHIAYRSTVSCGELALSGWITAFCLWSPEGKWLPWESVPAIPKQPPVPPPVVRPPWKEPVEAGGPSKGNALTRAGKRLSRAWPALLRKSGERRKVVYEPSSQKTSEQAAVEASSTSGQGGPRRSLVEHGKHSP